MIVSAAGVAVIVRGLHLFFERDRRIDERLACHARKGERQQTRDDACEHPSHQ
jgi:hypothetical protein